MNSSRCQMKKIHMGIPLVTFSPSLPIHLPLLSPSSQVMLHSLSLTCDVSVSAQLETSKTIYNKRYAAYIYIYFSHVFFAFIIIWRCVCCFMTQLKSKYAESKHGFFCRWRVLWASMWRQCRRHWKIYVYSIKMKGQASSTSCVCRQTESIRVYSFLRNNPLLMPGKKKLPDQYWSYKYGGRGSANTVYHNN